MKSTALSVVVITVPVLLIMLSPHATANINCVKCIDHRFSCVNSCKGGLQSCVNKCYNGYDNCLLIHSCSVNGRLLRRDEADLLQERYKSRIY